MLFNLQSDYKPAWDQPEAIRQITEWFDAWEKSITLMGATGTGKTFTMANIIQQRQKPTLVISHNKTLAAQLATEFKHFFPNNAVHYFVSYFDYYQPESYVPSKDLYIEKEATVNQEIEMYRLATMASLISREDVIVVASASSLYGIGQKEFFADYMLTLEVGKSYEFRELKKKLISMRYEPVQSKIEPGMFDFKGEMLDIYVSTEKYVYRCFFNEDVLEMIQLKDAETFNERWQTNKVIVWPATQYLQNVDNLDEILTAMDKEMKQRVYDLQQAGKLVEAQRLEKRVSYDIRMIRETGFVNGIENYSPYFDKRLPGEVPYTIFDYFPDDFLLIIDESHMTLPQLQAMPKADTSRKINLINHGFRLPSAIDHRPIRFTELEVGMDRAPDIDHTLSKKLKPDISLVQPDLSTTEEGSESPIVLSDLEQQIYDYQTYRNDLFSISTDVQHNHTSSLEAKRKSKAKTLFVSATPAKYEMTLSDQIVEQIIRPTWLLDPIVRVYPKSGDFSLLMKSIDTLVTKKPHTAKFLQWYEEVEKAEVFDDTLEK